MWGKRGLVLVFFLGFCRTLGMHIVRADKFYSFILLIWLKVQGQEADSEALFLWLCLEWDGFCRGSRHLCACVIVDCGNKTGNFCSCWRLGGMGVHEVLVCQWSECEGTDSTEVDQSNHLFQCKEGLVWVQACWIVSHIERICRSSFLVIEELFWCDILNMDNNYPLRLGNMESNELHYYSKFKSIVLHWLERPSQGTWGNLPWPCAFWKLR